MNNARLNARQQGDRDMWGWQGRARRWLAAGLAILVGLGLIAIALLSGHAEAHDFYDQWCCSGQDCNPADAGAVRWTPAGWSVSATHEIVPFSDPRVRFTPADQPQFHICIVPGQQQLRCLYVPQPEG